MIDIDEDARVEPSAPGRSSCMGPEPTVDETLPPFDIGFEPSNDLHGKSSVEPPLGNLSEKPSSINQTNETQDPPEIMRKASSEVPELNLSAGANIDPMEVSQDGSPFLRKIITSPITNQALSPVRGSLHGTSTPNVPGISTDDPFEDEPIHIEYQLPEMRIVPSPPQVKDNKRKRMTKVQEKRKRRPKFDNEIVFSNVYMKKQIDGDELCNLVFKRRKLPQTAVDMWKFNRTSQKDMFLLGPLVYGMCTNLHETYERKFPRATDSDAESAADEGTASEANVGVRDAPPERQLTPNSPGNADAPSELPAQKSPGNANARTECELTSEPPGNADAAQYEDTAPEFPRFSPQDIPSPIRDDDTPFKTPGGTPQSGRGGTGATEIPPADGTYVSPGQMTRDSDPKVSPFPFNDELDGDLPEIPGLISTPGVISSASTRATWLGSMSTRTRAVAQYFKDHMPSTTSDDQPGKFSLNRILEGRARKQAARMFFETLVLKSYDYIDVHQEEAYGDIAVSVKPSLSAAKF